MPNFTALKSKRDSFGGAKTYESGIAVGAYNQANNDYLEHLKMVAPDLYIEKLKNKITVLSKPEFNVEGKNDKSIKYSRDEINRTYDFLGGAAQALERMNPSELKNRKKV
jgi:hypothetical protein